MKQYIKPITICAHYDVQTSILRSSDPENEQLRGDDVFMSKKNDFSFDDESWGDSSWPKSKSAWDE